jgi:pimeloyl-ACP methyl ester carboxylesterase
MSTADDPQPTPVKRAQQNHDHIGIGTEHRFSSTAACVDGSGWEAVYNILKKDGYAVSIAQHPTTSLADDVAYVRRLVAAQEGPVLLVGHSYGGVVTTEAGNDPKVAGLVYIAAFAPDKGESVESLISNPVPGAPVPPILRPRMASCCWTRTSSPPRSPPTSASRRPPSWRASQVPWGVAALAGACRGLVEEQAELVPGGHGRQDDSAAGPACDVAARRLHGRRSPRQPRCLTSRSPKPSPS